MSLIHGHIRALRAEAEALRDLSAVQLDVPARSMLTVIADAKDKAANTLEQQELELLETVRAL